ncbi:MAG: 16S rRNA (cytidine(1402)-2'-O)-methyltransferase [Anaerolineales bacterium]
MLYLVATPIGNLDDITLRALEILKEVDIIASEDTRKTGRLLKHFHIDKRQIPFHEHNKERASEQIMALLQEGRSVALVTSAGTPGIADPGFTLVRAAIRENVDVTMIPGPTAFVVALVLSNLPLHSFTFRGFTPRKKVARKKFYEADRNSPYTLIYYESPYRLIRSLKDALEVFGNRQAALAHELTKLHESVIRGTLPEIVERVSGEEVRGEYVLLIAGTEAS